MIIRRLLNVIMWLLGRASRRRVVAAGAHINYDQNQIVGHIMPWGSCIQTLDLQGGFVVNPSLNRHEIVSIMQYCGKNALTVDIWLISGFEASRMPLNEIVKWIVHIVDCAGDSVVVIDISTCTKSYQQRIINGIRRCGVDVCV